MSLTPITSPLLAGLQHGFFSRQGGVSQGIYESLNCGPGSGDDGGAVAENRSRVAAHLGARALLSVHQIHSDKVVTVTDPDWAERPQADAMVTDRPGTALGALAADCAPVLFADAQAGVIGAAHAGWKGALHGVLEATVDAMRGLGAREIRAVVGPAISQRAYEVGPEFLESFMVEDPDYMMFFAQGPGDRYQFDLPGFALSRLRAAGAEAEWCGHCTYSDPARYFSYRRTTHIGEPDYGRQVSAIRL